MGRVVVLDVAFASEASGGGFEKITRPFIEGLGRRLAAWVDHHDHVKHEAYRDDPRFVLATKAEHGACPEMVTPELVAKVGPVDTLVCHTDFDGLCSAAKWMRGGVEPYPGADDDARAIDTRVGTPGPLGARLDAAIRGRPRDLALLGLLVRHLAGGLEDTSLWGAIDAAAAEGRARSEEARAAARGYTVVDVPSSSTLARMLAAARARILPGTPPAPRPARLAFLDATSRHGRYDKTELLLMGQERADVAVVVDKDNLTLAAPFGSGVNFLEVMGLSGGMPTLVSVPSSRLAEALRALGVSEGDVVQLV